MAELQAACTVEVASPVPKAAAIERSAIDIALKLAAETVVAVLIV